MHLLSPLTITDSIFVSSTVAEPHATEAAWVSAGTYAVADLRIRSTTHRVYQCIQAHTGRTALPEVDVLYWTDIAPTVRWAPFDSYTSTASVGTTTTTYVLSPGFFDAISLYELSGQSMSVTVKDGPGGAVLNSQTISLYEESGGLYEYLYTPSRPKKKVIVTGLPLHPTAELTVSVTSTTTTAIGMLNVGQYVNLVNDWGGAEYGASVEPISYSRIKTDDYGNVTIKRGNATSGMRATVVLPIADANYALQSVQKVLDVPVSWVASSAGNYAGLNVFGLGSASLSYDTPATVRLTINVKGMI